MFSESVPIRRALQSSINETNFFVTRTGMYFGTSSEMTTTLPSREELLCEPRIRWASINETDSKKQGHTDPYGRSIDFAQARNRQDAQKMQKAFMRGHLAGVRYTNEFIKKADALSSVCFLYGPDGNRTRVRKPIGTTFFADSLLFRSPPRVREQTRSLLGQPFFA